jgi:hypothetical protein
MMSSNQQREAPKLQCHSQLPNPPARFSHQSLTLSSRGHLVIQVGADIFC